ADLRQDLLIPATQPVEAGAHGRQLLARTIDEFDRQLGDARAHRGGIVFRCRVHRAPHRALTCPPSVIGSKGLAIAPMADNSRYFSVSSALTFAVMKITGMCARPASSRMRFSRVGPSMP